MSRATTVLILLVVVLIGALYLLSSRASEVPTRTIETDVEAPGNAG